MATRIDRRGVLKGIAGAALVLPALEAMGEGAQWFGQLEQHRQGSGGVEVVVHGRGEALAGGCEGQG